MTGPFSGMDPWLERPTLWPGVHDNLIISLQRALAPLIGPRYYVDVRQRLVPEDYWEIVEAATEQVVTVIEILSLSNKMSGKDRRVYEYKRERIFRTPTHLVEIDLLRAGEPMPVTFLQTNGHTDHYRIPIKRGDRGRRAYLYPFNVREVIPVFALPLQPGDHEPPVRLGEALK